MDAAARAWAETVERYEPKWGENWRFLPSIRHEWLLFWTQRYTFWRNQVDT